LWVKQNVTVESAKGFLKTPPPLSLHIFPSTLPLHWHVVVACELLFAIAACLLRFCFSVFVVVVVVFGGFCVPYYCREIDSLFVSSRMDPLSPIVVLFWEVPE
jgi:hypothetical protein